MPSESDLSLDSSFVFARYTIHYMLRIYTNAGVFLLFHLTLIMWRVLRVSKSSSSVATRSRI